jgi:hypothetical protein
MEPNSLTAELETQLEIQTRELAETRKALAEALHNADDCGKDYEGSGTEIVNASPAAVLLRLTLHGRRIRVLHLEPIGRAAGAVK